MGDAAPDFGERAFGSPSSALGQTAGEHGRVERRGTRCADAFERNALVLEQAVEYTPSESATRASPLQRKIDQYEIGRAADSVRPGRLAVAGSSAAMAKYPRAVYRPVHRRSSRHKDQP